MIESRCGLRCGGCPWKNSHGCGGCIETLGHPFHGECPVAVCCQEQGFSHCGECPVIPCDQLYSYSYLDPEHGDRPPGARVAVCRRWAAEDGKQAWNGVLLTSAGFRAPDGRTNENIRRRFLTMLGKPAHEARVLFIPTAAVTDEAKFFVPVCRRELLEAGVKERNIREYDIDGSIATQQVMDYDALYFTGGSTVHLMERIRDTGFEAVVRQMVHSGKVYVGVSAGSMAATAFITGSPSDNPHSRGLALVNVCLSVHRPDNTAAPMDSPLPHIALTDRQALAATCLGYDIITG